MMRSCLYLLIVLSCISCSEAGVETLDYELTDEQITTWIEDLSIGMSTGEIESFGAAFDMESFTNRTLNANDLGLQKYLSNLQFIKGAKQGMYDGMDNIGAEINMSMDSLLGYQLVRHYENKGVHRALFRLYGFDGLNYHEYELANFNGEAKAVDVKMMMTGENLSETFRQLLVSSGAFNGTQESAEAAKDFELIEKLNDAMAEGDINHARHLYEKMSDEFKQSKSIRLVEMSLAYAESDSAYLESLTKYLEDFPDEVNGDLMAIDYYLVQEKPTEALKALDRMDDNLGGDPFLNSMRASIQLDLNAYDKASKSIEKYKQSGFPLIADVVYTEALIDIGTSQFAQATEHLDVMINDHGYSVGDFAFVEWENRFGESTEYRNWKDKVR